MGKWWLVSWTTYGTWLPGDERGYCTWRAGKYVPPPKRYAKPGESTYQADDHIAVRELAESISDQPVYFNLAEQKLAYQAVVNEITQIKIAPAILAVGRWHVHWLCYFGTLEIRQVVGRVKAAATRELNSNGFEGKRPWTRGCNIRSKATRDECRTAYRYVANHAKQGGLIHKWTVDPKYLRFE
jgi:hypothetical protein